MDNESEWEDTQTYSIDVLAPIRITGNQDDPLAKVSYPTIEEAVTAAMNVSSFNAYIVRGDEDGEVYAIVFDGNVYMETAFP